MRHFEKAEGDARPGLIGVQGTGWFLSSSTIVTAEHVTSAMKLSSEDWKQLEIVDTDGSQLIDARIQRLVGSEAEKLAVVELNHALAGAQIAVLRKEPLIPEEQVITVASTADHLHLITGRFVRFGDAGKLTGLALLEVYEGENRLVIDHGASGSPVFDCSGRVVAVVSNIFTQSIWWASRQIRVSTAWGMPNVVSVPVQALNDLSQANLK